MPNDPAHDAPDDFLPNGATLSGGTYEITGQLGSGGFGLTYLAQDNIGREVVVKECFSAAFCRREGVTVQAHSPTHEKTFSRLIRSFVHEAQQQARLKHPNVVPVMHFFEENRTAYMVLERIPGDDLGVYVDRSRGGLDPRTVMDIAWQLSEALDYLHSNGILHRDVSPDNVIVTPKGRPVLIDFGASRNETAQAISKLAASQIRTVKDGYSPQEFYIPGRPHTPASDLYSLGATFYNLITGRTPVDAQARMNALNEGREDPLEHLKGHHPQFPELFLDATDQLMGVLPIDRPQSARELLEMLQPCYNDGPEIKPVTVEGAEPEPRAPVAEANGRRTPILIPAIGVGVMAMIVAAMFLIPTGSGGEVAEAVAVTESPAAD